MLHPSIHDISHKQVAILALGVHDPMTPQEFPVGATVRRSSALLGAVKRTGEKLRRACLQPSWTTATGTRRRALGAPTSMIAEPEADPLGYILCVLSFPAVSYAAMRGVTAKQRETPMKLRCRARDVTPQLSSTILYVSPTTAPRAKRHMNSLCSGPACRPCDRRFAKLHFPTLPMT